MTVQTVETVESTHLRWRDIGSPKVCILVRMDPQYRSTYDNNTNLICDI